MSKKLAAKIGTYEKDGEQKNRYINLGVVLEGKDGGEFMLLDPTVNLAGALQLQNLNAHKTGGKVSDRLLVSVFEDRPQQQQRQPQRQAQPAQEVGSDDIPF